MGDKYDSQDAAAERDLVNEVEDDELEDDPLEDDWDYDEERGVWW